MVTKFPFTCFSSPVKLKVKCFPGGKFLLRAIIGLLQTFAGVQSINYQSIYYYIIIKWYFLFAPVTLCFATTKFSVVVAFENERNVKIGESSGVLKEITSIYTGGKKNVQRHRDEWGFNVKRDSLSVAYIFRV